MSCTTATFMGSQALVAMGPSVLFFYDGSCFLKLPVLKVLADYVHNDSAPTVNACGRHVGCGQYDSRSPDGPLICLNR